MTWSLDRKIELSLPAYKEQQDIWSYYLSCIALESKDDIEKLSDRMTSVSHGFSGADISFVINESVIRCLDRRGAVENETAVSWLLPSLDDILSVSIIPRTEKRYGFCVPFP